MLRSGSKLGLCLLACMIAFLKPAGGQVVNGDFETGNLTGWTIFTTANGTLGTGFPAVSPFDVTGLGASNAACFSVGQINGGEIGHGGGIYQNVNLSGGPVLFSTAVAVQGGSAMDLDSGFFTLFLDGLYLTAIHLGSIAPGEVKRGFLSALVNASAGIHQIRIEMIRGSIWTPSAPVQYLDNVRLTAVPEPGGLALFGAGVLALPLGTLRHKRKQRV